MVAGGCGREGGVEIRAHDADLDTAEGGVVMLDARIDSVGGGDAGRADTAPAGLACGDGLMAGSELCDDGNLTPGDGCLETCRMEPGWTCTGQPSACTPTFPSCMGLATTTCAPSHPDCCGSSLVTGGTFQRDNTSGANFQATVGDFWLDTYEISVGRFARFVAAYPGSKPQPGTGKNPRNPADPGWEPAWDEFLLPDKAALTKAIQCEQNFQTWGRGDNLAMNCITWYEAYAFCIWDGGRLATELEWNYASAGGADQRYYPWSNPFSSKVIDPSYAVYSPAPTVASVGSTSPKGDGKYGQADLGGNVWEWLQDWYAPYPTTCTNCASLAVKSSTERVLRGGSYYDDSSYLPSDIVDVYDPTSRISYIGSRCARNR